MKNERGEVVAGVMVLMMAGMMIFGLIFMYGMHGGHGDHSAGNGDKQTQHSDSDHRHMHDSAADKDSAPAEDGEK
ncbi:MAG TPA: hypothetical protein VLG72_05410 [Nitrospirota bacterium]|nr:hypothetical protein [Nitrospirota bacterium]